MDKRELREWVWDELEDRGVARFPYPPHGRIPNFAGASDAAELLTELEDWQNADVIKSNPDSPQLPVRRRALREGKIVYMAVPRLRDARCFLELDPTHIEDTDAAATVSKGDRYAERVAPDAMPEVNLVVSGSVAVTPDGVRIGKGEGYSDLEYALLSEFGLVGAETTVATTVHDLQVVETAPDPADHDVPIDLVVTPTRPIRTGASRGRSGGIDWSALPEERIREIPALERLRP